MTMSTGNFFCVLLAPTILSKASFGQGVGFILLVNCIGTDETYMLY